MKPKVLSRKIKYKGIWLKVERKKIKLPNSKVVEWEDVIAEDAVAIVAVDEKKDIYFSKEWRSAFEKEILQIPIGGCKGKTYKAQLKQARNELREEIGFDAKKWEKLITVLLGARQKTKVHIFLAEDLFPSKKEREDTEIIEVVKMPFKKAYQLILENKILTTSSTILGILLAKEKLKL